MRKIILQCGCTLLGLSLFFWWLFFFSPLTIPDRFALTHIQEAPSINLHGLTLWVTMTTVLWFFLKRYFRQDPEAAIGDMVSVGLLAELFSEVIFQMVRQFTYPEFTPTEHVRSYLAGVLVMSFMAGIISLFIARRLRKNRIAPWISTLLLLLACYAYQSLHTTGWL